jgi:iron-sulfur cluster repair protein YtfE (RIC family)
MFSGIAIVLLGWGVSVEGRIGSMSTIQTERTSVISHQSQEISQLYDLVRDPSPKPETKVEIEGMKIDHERMDQRLGRLEERMNNVRLGAGRCISSWRITGEEDRFDHAHRSGIVRL